MSQPRPNVVTFVKSPPSELGSPVSKLHSIRLVMARASWPRKPTLSDKAGRLASVAPDMAVYVEALIDDLLADVS